jgi:hypothetical protein
MKSEPQSWEQFSSEQDYGYCTSHHQGILEERVGSHLDFGTSIASCPHHQSFNLPMQKSSMISKTLKPCCGLKTRIGIILS